MRGIFSFNIKELPNTLPLLRMQDLLIYLVLLLIQPQILSIRIMHQFDNKH